MASIRQYCARIAIKNSAAERRVWEYPAPYSAIMRETIRQRYELVPGDTIITVEGHPAYREDMADGLKGLMTRLARVKYYNTLATMHVVTHPRERLGVDAAQTGARISRNPSSFTAEKTSLPHMLVQLPGMLAKLGAAAREDSQPNSQRKAYCAKARAILRGLRQEMRSQELGENMR